MMIYNSIKLINYKKGMKTMTPEELFEKNIKLAYFTANKLWRKSAGLFIYNGYSNEDIDQLALMSLWRSAHRFNPDLNFKFSTYAVKSIEGSIRNSFREVENGFRVPREAKKIADDMRRRLKENCELKFTYKDIMEEFNVSKDAAKIAIELIGFSVYDIMSPVPGGENEKNTFADIIPDPISSSSYDNLLREIEKEEALNLLKENEREIFNLYLKDKYTQRQMANIVGVSQVQVSRIIRICLEKIENYYKVSA